jgi:ABC-type phosphate/phosphonate transport system substrate-binding protein
MKNILTLFVLFSLITISPKQAFSAESIFCWFPPSWSSKIVKAEKITKALSEKSGIQVRPRIAKSYPEILTSFATGENSLVYVGSFVQAIIKARGLGTPLVQSVNGKELYSGILVYPKGQDPVAILKISPSKIAYAIGASSGESTAKAATEGKASIGTKSHTASVAAIKSGVAKAAVVKNWWWEANKNNYPNMEVYNMPSYSKIGNPDNVLTASHALTKEKKEKIIVAAMQSKDAFGADSMRLFPKDTLMFSLWLMKIGGIDPATYSWE